MFCFALRRRRHYHYRQSFIIDRHVQRWRQQQQPPLFRRSCASSSFHGRLFVHVLRITLSHIDTRQIVIIFVQQDGDSDDDDDDEVSCYVTESRGEGNVNTRR